MSGLKDCKEGRAMTTYERTTVNGIQLIHTYRGNDLEIEVYYHQDGPKTYNLFKRKEDREWRCDWVTSHSHHEVALDADPTDLSAMLQAFTAMIGSQR
jgi:hypothetical protein